MRSCASLISSLAFSQPALRGGDVAGAVLRLPGKAFAHGMELAQLAEMAGEQPPLAGIPRALDELHHGAGEAMGDTAHDHAEGGGGFALARAGMDDDQALLAALLRHHAVARGLLLRHFGGVACVEAVLRCLVGIPARSSSGAMVHSFGLTSGTLGQMVPSVLVPVL